MISESVNPAVRGCFWGLLFALVLFWLPFLLWLAVVFG